MRSVLQQHKAAGAYEELFKGIRILETPRYSEVEVPLDNGNFGVIYVIRRDEHSYYACAAMPDNISLIMNEYVDTHARTRGSASELYRQTWPMLIELLNNGLKECYSPAALTILEDPDDAIRRWSIASIVGNVGSLRGNDILQNQRMLEALLRVLSSSEVVIQQVATSSIDVEELAGIRLRSDMGAGFTAVGNFVTNNLKPLTDLLSLWAKNGQS